MKSNQSSIFALYKGNILQRRASSCQQTKRDPLSEYSSECDWIRFPRSIKMARVQESWGLKREAFASLVDSLDANESCRRFGKSWDYNNNVQRQRYHHCYVHRPPSLNHFQWCLVARGSHPMCIYPMVVHSNWEGGDGLQWLDGSGAWGQE